MVGPTHGNPYTLHDAMAVVLRLRGGLPAKDLALEISERRLYHRADGRPAPPSQISARAHRYPNLFDRIDGVISLRREQYCDRATGSTEVAEAR